MTASRLSIVVPTRNEASGLPRLLRSVLRENITPDQIIVADNESPDGTAEVARSFGVRVLMHPGNRSDRINLGTRGSDADFVVILDGDMEVEPGLISELDELYRGGHEIVIIPEVSIARKPLAQARAFERSLYDGDLAVESTRAVSTRIFWQCGGYDPGMAGCEDWEFGNRAASLAAPVRSTKRIIHHELDLTPTKIFKKYSEYGRGFYALFKTDARSFFRHSNPIRKSVITKWRILLQNPRATFMLLMLKTLVWSSGFVGFVSAAIDERKSGIRE